MANQQERWRQTDRIFIQMGDQAMEQIGTGLDVRVARLERCLKLFQMISAGTAVIACLSVVCFMLEHQSYDRGRADILRVRGLIVEDAAGYDRILIGAPVPAVNGRKRRDNTVGLIVLGENGADRLALAAPTPEPQIHGVIAKRIGGQAGFVVDDENGDERGGFGVLDNDGRVSLGLDYPHGTAEAISIGVLPGENSIAIHDSRSIIRAAFLERKDSPPIMYGVHLFKHVVTQASDAALNRALDDMSTK